MVTKTCYSLSCSISFERPQYALFETVRLFSSNAVLLQLFKTNIRGNKLLKTYIGPFTGFSHEECQLKLEYDKGLTTGSS